MEKTEKKTAEEILDKHIAIKLEAFPDIAPAMHEFAAQQLASYKASLRAKVMDISKYDEDLKMKVIELIDKTDLT